MCGCSFMTSSRGTYLELKGPDWPQSMPWDFDQLPDFVQQELNDFGYKHCPSFMDLAAQQRGWDLTYFSQLGASNFMIRRQIDQVLALKPDLAVVAATDPNRVDIKKDKNLLKHYYTNQDLEIDQLKSYYFLCNGLDQLEKAKIPYVFLPGPMKDMDWSDRHILWPASSLQPWDLRPMRLDLLNHIPTQDHLDFCKILLSLI